MKSLFVYTKANYEGGLRAAARVPMQMKAFRLNKCENYGIKNCMSSTLKDISCQKKNNFSESVEFQLLFIFA